MSDNQRRIFCRLLFLFFCCLPTALIVYRACHPRTPEFWQRSIQSQLGIDTMIADVETPSPGQTILRGLTLFGAEGNPILSAIETRFDEQQNRITINERVRLTGTGLKELADSLNQRLVGSGTWSIVLDDVEVIDDSPEGTGQGVYLSPVEIAIMPTGTHRAQSQSANAVLSVRFSAGAGEVQNPLVQCRFLCHEDPVMTSVDIKTGTQHVPCWLVRGWLPQLADLGPHATFVGRIGIDPVSEKNIGRVKGRFEKVSLPGQLASATPTRSLLDHTSSTSQTLGANAQGAMEVDMAFDDSSRRRLAQGQPLQLTATLELPDGSKHRVMPVYHFQQVLNIGSAIGQTVRTARSRSVSNKYQ